MALTEELPKPNLNARQCGARCVPVLTDDALFAQVGVRIAFTGRAGGVSEPPYDTFNLGTHVGDDRAAVERNRLLLLDALEVLDAALVVPNQVHGDVLVNITSADEAEVAAKQAQASEGADGFVVSAPQVAALLCFADCVPVIIVSPTGRFAVVHAGWRGVLNGIVPAAVQRLATLDASELGPRAATGYNVYLGPHIHAECFETGDDVRQRFVSYFGPQVAPDKSHVDLTRALRDDVRCIGVAHDRIVDSGVCTVCTSDRFFSYRASGGTCGRHGAFAVRVKG